MVKKHEEKTGIEERTIPIVTTTSRLVKMLREFNGKYYPNADVNIFPDNTVLVRTPEPASNLESIYALLTADKKGISCMSYSGNKTFEYLIGFWSCAGEGRL